MFELTPREREVLILIALGKTSKEIARDRVLSDDELVRVILAAGQIDDRYGALSSCWPNRTAP